MQTEIENGGVVPERPSSRDFEDELRRLTDSIVGGDPIDTVLGRLTEAVERRLPDTSAAVVTVEDQGGIVVSASRSIPSDLLEENYRLSIAEPSAPAPAAPGQVVVIADVAVDTRTKARRDQYRRAGIAACWSVPMLGPNGSVLGVLTAYSGRAGAPTPDVFSKLTDAARMASVALLQHRTRSELRDSQQRLRLLSDVLCEVAWDWDLESDRCWVDERAMEVFGWDSLDPGRVAERWRAGVHEDDRRRIDARLAEAIMTGDDDWADTYRFIRPDQHEVTLMARARIVRAPDGQGLRLVGGTSYVTLGREAEIDRLRDQRLESLGSLAGGIAHDLNNVFTPIMMSASLLLARHPLTTESRELVEIMRRSAERGSHMVKQIVTFARGSIHERRTVWVPDLVNEVVAMVRDSFLQRVEVQVIFAEDIATIRADASLLHQVLVNLCVNARDAMPDGGRLTIEVDEVDLDSAVYEPAAAPGRYVRIAVSDSGTGIPDEVMPRLFEPFFTTKSHGEGTGLGLSTSIKIVEGHSGFITVDTELNVGSKFSVHLPAERAHDGLTGPDERQETPPAGKGQIVLLVDDEEDVLEVSQAMLTAHGFYTLTARDGAEALAWLERRRVDIVVTDLMMPVMDGLTMLRSLRRLVPGVPVIATTGHEIDHPELSAVIDDRTLLLPKPYSTDDLLKAVESVS